MIHCLHSWKLFISYRNVFIFIPNIADVTFNLLLQKHLKALPGAFMHLFPKHLRVIALKPHFYQENSTPMSIYLHRIPNSDTEPQLWQMWKTTYLNTGIVRMFLNCSLKEGGKKSTFLWAGLWLKCSLSLPNNWLHVPRNAHLSLSIRRYLPH